MNTGAVAFLDALGFKGIWERWAPESIVSKLRTFDRAFNSYDTGTAPQEADHYETTRRVRFLSDTIVVAASVSPKTPPRGELPFIYSDFIALYEVCRSAEIIQRALLHPFVPPPIAYRGAISWGEFHVEDKYLIGPAIDEAAAAERVAEAAVVWLCASASDRLEEIRRRDSYDPTWQLPLGEWDVPMKGSEAQRAWVVRPDTPKDDLITGLRAAFRLSDGQDDRVQEKFQKTSQFLCASEELMQERRRRTLSHRR